MASHLTAFVTSSGVYGKGARELPHLRASWGAFRSMRRGIDAVVGATHGMPVYSIAGVQVVLPPRARHFRRVVECARCHVGVTDHGRPVRRRSDLGRDVRLTCRRCSALPELVRQRRVASGRTPSGAPALTRFPINCHALTTAGQVASSPENSIGAPTRWGRPEHLGRSERNARLLGSATMNPWMCFLSSGR
jgi:hypothetical protein